MANRIAQAWRELLDPTRTHPAAALLLGLGLVAALVPILSIWNGSHGPLGQSIPLFFLVPVLLASAAGGRLPGIVVAVVAVFVWDWFFIPPFHRVTVASVRDLLALLVFLAVALLTGQLATIARRQTREALQRAHTTEALYDLSFDLIAGGRMTDVLPRLVQRLRDTFDLQACAVLLRQGEQWRTAAVSGDLPQQLRVEQSRSVAAMIEWANRTGHTFGFRDSDQEDGSRAALPRAPSTRVQVLPIHAGERPIGVLELVQKSGVAPDAEQERLLITFANGVALALEQERLAEEERAAAIARESDRLKSALLSSVSHDLRTPLAGIKAAASSLTQEDVTWSEEDRRAFAQDINSEADRLSRLVSNLLDLSRIEAGSIVPARDWEDLGELIHRVTRRLQPRLGEHEIRLDMSDTLPLVYLDPVQIEQVLTNLIENAAKYAPAGTPVTIEAGVTDTSEGREAWVIVSDQGPGIPASERSKIFDKFYRISGSGRSTGGIGMGLAIVKGLVEAHGGKVAVESRPGEGSTFTVVLPTPVPGEPRAPAPTEHVSGRSS